MKLSEKRYLEEGRLADLFALTAGHELLLAFIGFDTFPLLLHLETDPVEIGGRVHVVSCQRVQAAIHLVDNRRLRFPRRRRHGLGDRYPSAKLPLVLANTPGVLRHWRSHSAAFTYFKIAFLLVDFYSSTESK